MTYSKSDDRWYRVDCFKKIYFDPDSVDLKLTKNQIKTFLERLAGPEGCQYNGFTCKCGGKEFTFAKKILRLMKIPEEKQETLLRLCKAYGGYCDCEILMNAAPHLLGEETPW